jgi:hypothetical protein
MGWVFRGFCLILTFLSAARFSGAQMVGSHADCVADVGVAARAVPSGSAAPTAARTRAASDSPRKAPLRAERHGEIAVIFDDGRLFGPASWRDFENVTFHFEPHEEPAQGYHFRRGELEWREPAGEPVSHEPGWPLHSLEVELPFDFPFGGQVWRKVILNSTGTISFDYREDRAARPRYFEFREYGQRRLVFERMIAGLWTTTYDVSDHKLWWQVSDEEAVATWHVTETFATGQAFRAAPGYDEFQIVLRRGGGILLSYRQMTTPVGVAGVFPGRSRYAVPQPLARQEVPERKEAPGYANIRSVAAERISGNEMLLRKELREEPVAGRPGLYYRHFLDTTGPFTPGGMPFGEQELTAFAFWRDGRWQFRVETVSTSLEAEGEVDGREVRIVVPLGEVARGGKLRWFADALDYAVNGAYSQSPAQVLEIPAAEGAPSDLSLLASGLYRGPIFEFFHGHFTRSGMEDWSRQFYEHFADNADFLVFYMSGRRDWTEGGARSSGPVAGGIRGAGLPAGWRTGTGSAGRLQGMQEVSWIGAFSCEPSGHSGDFGPFSDYSLAVWMNGHELGHRWGVALDPPGRSEYPRISDNVHWLWELHHPAAFCEPGPPCSSLMGGAYWEEAEPGYYVQRAKNGYLQATGYGPLDLYLMGLARPEEIPRLFVLANPRWEFRWGYGWGVPRGQEGVRHRRHHPPARASLAGHSPLAERVQHRLRFLRDAGRRAAAVRPGARRGNPPGLDPPLPRRHAGEGDHDLAVGGTLALAPADRLGRPPVGGDQCHDRAARRLPAAGRRRPAGERRSH